MPKKKPHKSSDEVPFSIRFNKELTALIEDTGKKVGLNFTDTIRQALKVGCPALVQKLNVPPAYE